MKCIPSFLIFLMATIWPYHSAVASLILDPIENIVTVTDGPVDNQRSVEISASASFNNSNNLWEYRYLISAINESRISQGQFVIKEDVSHENIHHLENIKPLVHNTKNTFRYDDVQRTEGFGAGNLFFSMLHNYSWSNLTIEANNEVLFGFDDIHAPSLERWQIYLGGDNPNYIQGFGNARIPVPSLSPLGDGNGGDIGADQIVGWGGRRLQARVPEPSSLILLSLSIAALCFQRRKPVT